MARKASSKSASKRTASQPVTELKNIGQTVAGRLAEVGIESRADLKRTGAAAAYRQIKANYPDTTLPVCYYLYSLEAALKDVHWDALPAATKTKLKQKAGIE